LEFDKSALFIQEWMEEGEHKGFYSLTLDLLQHRAGPLDEMTQEQIRALSNQQLRALGVALLDFTGPADLQKWLSENVAEI
jgi:hypothetical protein